MSKSKKKIEDDLEFELYVTPTSSFVRREKKYDNETSKFEKKNFREKLDPKSFNYIYKNNIKSKERSELFNTVKMLINSSDDQDQELGGHCKKES